MLKKNSRLARVFSFSIILLVLSGCPERQEVENEGSPSVLKVATTTSTVGSGLFNVLIPVFESKHNIKVDVIAKGTGAALQLAREGKADVVFVHAREAEDKFVLEGYGVNRKDVMYNDFVILGPPDDPLKIRGEKNILSFLKQVFDQKQRFLSRGDRSGTHIREQALWKLTGIDPQGDWYIESKKGMLDSLMMASEQKAYVLSDRSTYLHNQEKLDLVILLEGDKRLFNPYGVIAVNPTKVVGVHFEAAMAFVDFVTSMEGQEIIAGYGRLKFGTPLFTPLAIKN